MTDPVPVVLLHGLGRNSRSLGRLERRLNEWGHVTENFDYPSRRHGVAACADMLSSRVEDFRQARGRQVAFVGHSMGGMVSRCIASASGGECVVMLAPPNGGSEFADALAATRIGKGVFGPAILELGTATVKVPVPSCPVGVIAGRRSYVPFSARFLGPVSDGVVGLERSRFPGMSDWVCVDAGHTLIMNHPDTVNAVLTFLAAGRFPARLRNLGRVAA